MYECRAIALCCTSTRNELDPRESCSFWIPVSDCSLCSNSVLLCIRQFWLTLVNLEGVKNSLVRPYTWPTPYIKNPPGKQEWHLCLSSIRLFSRIILYETTSTVHYSIWSQYSKIHFDHYAGPAIALFLSLSLWDRLLCLPHPGMLTSIVSIQGNLTLHTTLISSASVEKKRKKRIKHRSPPTPKALEIPCRHRYSSTCSPRFCEQGTLRVRVMTPPLQTAIS